ncbi:MAG: GAF domain-containing protein [Candidatus Heimdallarchaeota archaeon]|nr:GAF domain-containing protein [Candidatus Heimdallarchaeota archaeon]
MEGSIRVAHLTEVNEALKNLSQLFQSWREIRSIKDTFTETTRIIEQLLDYDMAVLYLLGEKGLCFIKTTGELEERELQTQKILNEKLFKNSSPLIYEAGFQESTISQQFDELQDIASVILIPLLNKKGLQGILACASKERHSFSSQELLITQIIADALNSRISILLYQEFLEQNNKELRSITKRMRHDFANDIQALALGMELLATTELNKEQKKYVEILDKSITSATKKLRELKELKKKVERDYQ